MAQVKVGDSVNVEIPLWRYMSLDKLISLLESDILYFTPLAAYQKSDPFEGYMPKVAFEAYSKIYGSSIKELEKVCGQLEIRSGQNKSQINELLKIREQIHDFREDSKNAFKAITKAITVNCWHANSSESEAMWKLYSDDGKGIAVKTSIASLVKSMEHFEQELLVQISAVKYLDFHDATISRKDCVTDGHLSPLLKRSSFSHENEVRLFTVPKIDISNLNEFVPQPEFVRALAVDLIEEIYISPFAGEPFISSVFAICNKYSIPHQIVNNSKLLEGHEDLLDSMAKW